jgi:hypothetical protein
MAQPSAPPAPPFLQSERGGAAEDDAGTVPGAPRAARQRRAQAQRVRYNRAVMKQGTRGELTGDLSVPCGLTESHRC